MVDEDADEPRPDYKASVHDGDFAETFRRLQHTCIKEFCFGIHYSPFLRYWKAQEAAVFTVVSIYSSDTNDADCGVLDSIMNHLRPRVVHIYASAPRWHNKGILDRDSFLQNLQICRLSVSVPSILSFCFERLRTLGRQRRLSSIFFLPQGTWLPQLRCVLRSLQRSGRSRRLHRGTNSSRSF